MNKIKTIATGGLFAAAIAIGVTTVVLLNKPNTSHVQGAETSAQQQADDHVSFIATRGQDVLTQLKQHAAVSTKDSQYGPFVDAINGKQQEGKYWSFYVNGVMADKGAADYVTNGGEKIEWKLE